MFNICLSIFVASIPQKLKPKGVTRSGLYSYYQDFNRQGYNRSKLLQIISSKYKGQFLTTDLTSGNDKSPFNQVSKIAHLDM